MGEVPTQGFLSHSTLTAEAARPSLQALRVAAATKTGGRALRRRRCTRAAGGAGASVGGGESGLVAVKEAAAEEVRPSL